MERFKKPFMLYFVGISGSGKTTIANALVKRLIAEGIDSEFLDGDEIRHHFNDEFGFTFEERMKSTRAGVVIAKYLQKHGISVILANVGAYREMRDYVRREMKDNYLEVYIKCSVDECARRDPKGYYNDPEKKLTNNFNGSDDVFEIPENSEIVIDTERMSVEEAVDRIVSQIESFGFV